MILRTVRIPAARTPASAPSERGLTLVELLVSMLIFSIVMTVVVSLFVSVVRTTAISEAISTNSKTAANGMNEAARVIRAGTENPVSTTNRSDPAFVRADNESVTLYAYINLDTAAEHPVMIRLSLDAQRRLVESRWPATALASGYWGFPDPATVPASTRILADTVAPHATGSPWLFTYLLANGDTLPVPATGALTDDQRRTIAAVRVTLTIQKSVTDAKHAVTLTNAVGIPNLGIPRTVR